MRTSPPSPPSQIRGNDGLGVSECCGSTITTARFRPPHASDLSAVEELLANAALPLQGVAEQFDDSYVIAEENGKPIGLAGVEIHGEDALLRSVAVDVAHRGHGLGLRLVLDRLQWARERGIRDVYLLTTTAVEFFARIGFTRTERNAAPEPILKSSEFASICGSSATAMRLSLNEGADIRAIVRSKYAGAARAAARNERASCCGNGKAKPWNPITDDLYDAAEKQGVPAEALLASLGCGNPTALAQLKPGEIVLDLGSGGGIDVLLSARRVGPMGKAYGLDMTDEMLALARENQRKAGVTNVEFLKGEIENIPLPENTVDVIISNCVINLSADKAKVLREAFRVLKPRGRFAVSDIVVRGDMPDAIRRNMELWMGCVSGALEENEYRALLAAAGFAEADIEPTRVYNKQDIANFASDAGLTIDAATAYQLDGRFMSAFVRARKPT